MIAVRGPISHQANEWINVPLPILIACSQCAPFLILNNDIKSELWETSGVDWRYNMPRKQLQGKTKGIDPSGGAKNRVWEKAKKGNSWQVRLSAVVARYVCGVAGLSYIFHVFADSQEKHHSHTKDLIKQHDWCFEHVVVIWCKLLAWQAFSKSCIWLNRHGEFPRKYHGILSYCYVLEKKDTLCKCRYALAIVIQLFSPVV